MISEVKTLLRKVKVLEDENTKLIHDVDELMIENERLRNILDLLNPDDALERDDLYEDNK